MKVLLDINPFPSLSVNWCQEASAIHYVSLSGGATSSETVSPGQYGGRKGGKKREKGEKWENGRGEERGEDLGGDRGRNSRTKRKKQERGWREIGCCSFGISEGHSVASARYHWSYRPTLGKVECVAST